MKIIEELMEIWLNEVCDRVTKEVKKYVEGYDACQRNKNQTEAPAEKLMPNTVPEKPWTHISADFITKLPLA